jgi:hypothetical protein
VELQRRAPAWLVALLATVAVALGPWTILLNARLPSRHVAVHWDTAWTGFDVALALVLLATAYGAACGRPWSERAAAVAGTLLVCDAWFDVLTSSTATEVTVAAIEAGVAEVPLAVLCFALAAGRVPLRSVETARRAR